MTTKGIREYNRLYGNLVELFRRVYAEESYPKETCAKWFVAELDELMSKDDLKNQLNEDHINHILEMGVNLRRTDFISNEYKKILTDNMKELKNTKKALVEAALVK